MEALEFIKQKNRMCDYYCGELCKRDDSGETCPASSIDCEITTDKPELLVAIVEKWAKEHPEKPERERQKPEHPEESSDLHAIIDEIEYRINKLADRIVALEKYPVESMNEQKRTNKDALLAAFPNTHMDNNGIPDICPRALDKNYNNCSDFADCSVCKCAYWLAETKE